MKLGGAALTMPLVSGCLGPDDEDPSGEMSGYANWISPEVYGDNTLLAVGLDRNSDLAREMGGSDAGVDAEGKLVQFAVGNPVLLLVSTESMSNNLVSIMSRSNGSDEGGFTINNVYAWNSETIVYAGSYDPGEMGGLLTGRGFSAIEGSGVDAYSGYDFYRSGGGGVVVGVSDTAVLASATNDSLGAVKRTIDTNNGESSSLASESEEFGTLASLLPNLSINTTLYMDRPRGMQEAFSVSVSPSGRVVGMSSNAGLVESDLEASWAILYSGENEVDGESALESLAEGADEVSVSYSGRTAVVEARYGSVV